MCVFIALVVLILSANRPLKRCCVLLGRFVAIATTLKGQHGVSLSLAVHEKQAKVTVIC